MKFLENYCLYKKMFSKVFFREFSDSTRYFALFRDTETGLPKNLRCIQQP